LPRHWKKNVGRLAEIELLDGTQFSGRINAVDGDKVQIEEQVFILDSIKSGKIQIEFNRKDLR
jgi:ribosome maturation factor RimP